MIVIILLSLVLFAILFDCYLHYKRSGRLIDLIPGPSRIPIFGSLFVIHGYSQEEVWRRYYHITDATYPIFKVWLGPIVLVFIRHPDDLETILNNTKQNRKSRLYDFLRPWLADGLLTSEGSKWHARRKILTPAFHFNILQHFTDIMIEESNRMVESLKDNEETVIKDLHHFLSEHTLNIICETAMGISLHNSTISFGTSKEQYRKSIEELGLILTHRLLSPWLYPSLLFALSPSGRKQAKTLKILHEFTEKVITERKLYHEGTNYRYLKNIGNKRSTETDEVFGGHKKRLALLDLLIAASRENNMTDVDIREEVDTFMFGGHDTTALAMCFILLLLAEHNEVQDRVRTEVNDVMQENGKLTFSSLQKLSYLERCVKEALRLYPSAHFISRVILEDINCQSYTVPANTIVNLNIYAVHRDPNFWPNPDVFDPDRFLPDQVQNRHPYSYLPFSAGRRNCIGQRFAMLEMKAMVASLVHKFYLEPVDDLKDLQIKTDVVLRPAHPVRVKFVAIANE